MFERIEALLKENGITQTKMLKDLGFSTGLFSQWKRGLQSPSPAKLKAIADYLGTTIGYLENGTTTAPAPPPGSKRESILAMIEPLSDNQLKDLLEYIRFLHWRESQKHQ